MTQEKQNAVNAIEEKAGLIGDVADHIWEYAELSLQEVKSAALYCEVLEKEGFQVEKGICGIETAFSASYGQGRPVIGFLAEYDALPEIGHACGHNLLGTAVCAAACALKEDMTASGAQGTASAFFIDYSD